MPISLQQMIVLDSGTLSSQKGKSLGGSEEKIGMEGKMKLTHITAGRNEPLVQSVIKYITQN